MRRPASRNTLIDAWGPPQGDAQSVARIASGNVPPGVVDAWGDAAGPHETSSKAAPRLSPGPELRVGDAEQKRFELRSRMTGLRVVRIPFVRLRISFADRLGRRGRLTIP